MMPTTIKDYEARLEEESKKYRANDFEWIDEEHFTVVIEDRYEFLIYVDDYIEPEKQKVSSRSGTSVGSGQNIIIEFQEEVNTGLLELSSKSGTIRYPNTETVAITRNTSEGELRVTSEDDSIASARIEGKNVIITPQAINEYEKQVTITVKAGTTDNYEEQTATYIATVRQGSITISATPYVGTYNETSHPALSNVSTDPTGCTLTYSLNGGSSYTSSIPTVTSQGTYTITIKAEKPGYVTKEETRTITINPGTITIYATARNQEYTGSSYTSVYGVSTNPSGCSITYKLNGTNYGTTVPTISAQGTYTVTITASKTGYNTATTTRTAKITAPSGPPWTIEQAKAVIKKDGLRSHLGEQVLYYPSAGGTWRIFYYDTEGYFGTTNTLYLKRDYDASTVKDYKTTETYGTGYARAIKMNPGWSTEGYANHVAWRLATYFCNENNFLTYKGTGAQYVYGTPSMYMWAKSYNVWKTGNPNGGYITMGTKTSEDGRAGEKTGPSIGGSAPTGGLEPGPYNMYFGNTNARTWLCTGSYLNVEFLCHVNGPYKDIGLYSPWQRQCGIEPVVDVGTT